jgi:hypothetical protein
MFLPSFEIHPSYFAKCSFHPLKFIPHTLPNVPSIFFCFFKFQSVCPATLFPTIRHFVAQICPNSYSIYIGRGQGFSIPITINASGPTPLRNGYGFWPCEIRWGWGASITSHELAQSYRTINNSKIKISSDQWEGVNSMRRTQLFFFLKGTGFWSGWFEIFFLQF